MLKNRVEFKAILVPVFLSLLNFFLTLFPRILQIYVFVELTEIVIRIVPFALPFEGKSRRPSIVATTLDRQVRIDLFHW